MEHCLHPASSPDATLLYSLQASEAAHRTFGRQPAAGPGGRVILIRHRLAALPTHQLLEGSTMKRQLLTFTVLLMLLALAVPALAQAAGQFPSTIQLPDGWSPEGISVGRGTTFYVGSIPTGSIWKGDLATGKGKRLVEFTPADGRFALGVFADPRTNNVFVAGGPSGHGYVYNGDTGATLADYALPGGLFINDVVVTEFGAYFTDSFRPYFYKVPLGPGGRLLPAPAITAVLLGGDFVEDTTPGAFNSNGIEVTPGGKWLIIDNSAQGKLYRVDPATGDATAVALGGGGLAVGFPDGLRFVGNRLYVVENFMNRIAVVEFAPGFASGTVTGHISGGGLDVPTTVAKFGASLYVPNSRFDVAPPIASYPGVQFDVVRLSR
jgi:sugar lactone lactonase YvrE